jgi:hypothetical protein
MGEDEGVRKRRVFQWSKQAKDLAREYKQRMIAGQHLGQVHRSALVARLVEISGNPREACLRLLCRSGAAQKRSYREWTKPEQRRLLDLITTMPVGEAAKILRRPSGSVRSMLHRLASVDELAGSGSPSTRCRGRCTPVPRRSRNGSTVDG